MLVKQLTVGAVQTNCYIAGCEKTKEGVIIDPGDNAPLILEMVKEMGLTIKYVLNTHAHFDHIMANAEVVEATGVPLAIHPLELPLLRQNGGAALFGLSGRPSPDPDMALAEGDTISMGQYKFEVLFTPGHTIGHVSFYEPNAHIIFDGDVLFAQGIGRTDLPGGSYDTLMRSIREKLLVLPDETIVYSGHGPVTTIGQERISNPWLLQ
ncbi:MBL fold metallo-hydrolase [Anaerolineales bacterium HSG25]|nr:MBL fold metallo-hydrolase [Anaerolineales bacterium HSG25]